MFDVPPAVSVAFWAVSALAVLSAVLVVTVKNVFRAALFLALSFAAVASLYFLMSADFIGIVQIIVYVGAVSVLIVFAIMLVRDVREGNRRTGHPVLAAIAAVLVAASLIYVGFETDWTLSEELVNRDAIEGLAGTYVIDPTRPDGSEGTVIAAAAGGPGVQRGVLVESTATLGTLFVRDYLLAFEIIGILLTAALIGALAIVRERRA